MSDREEVTIKFQRLTTAVEDLDEAACDRELMAKYRHHNHSGMLIAPGVSPERRTKLIKENEERNTALAQNHLSSFGNLEAKRKAVEGMLAAVWGSHGTAYQPKLPQGKLPTRDRDTDAGIDLYSSVQVTLEPGVPTRVKTGVAWSAPPGWALCIRDRSSMGGRGIGHLAGVIDSEYRGEIMVILVNHGDQPYTVEVGDKICQGILVRVPRVVIEEADELEDSDRGERGFGSSGK